MFNGEKKEQEFLSQLAIKLTASSHQLSEAAKRLQLAELTYREYLVRLRKLDAHMRNLIDLLQSNPGRQEESVEETNPEFCEPPPPPPPPSTTPSKKLRYADYIEFSNYAELKKFEKLDKISDEEVTSCDADDLMRKLMDDTEST